jgi:hypothetical protein
VIPFACLLLLAASSSPNTRLEQTDEDTYRIAAGDYQWVALDLRQHPATVGASFAVLKGSPQIRIALLTRDEYDRMRDDLSRLPEEALLAATPRGDSGKFLFRVHQPDSYVILLDNHAEKNTPAVVRMRIALDFSQPRVTRLSPERQLTVVAISCLTFFAVVTYSARKLLKATRS